ncbi:ATP-dependent RecD-like DNA helicase [Kribbella sancticallisti]|uniref:ATP-dependent RecD-like DNA helicase n=1 Tax=Kribbella sancticallisti TaxID=460087 RepID=A0ABN2EX66_9ACTN
MSKRDELSGQQAQAMRRIKRWYGSGASQTYRLFGYAGTGKTTLARKVAGHLGIGSVMYAAYTGKAAHVMRSKGCEGASTLHSLIYLPVEKVRAEADELKAELNAERNADRRTEMLDRIRKLETDLSTPEWIVNRDSPLRDADLLIIDEVSMVDEVMAKDVLSFGVPVLALGDPAQLPPPRGSRAGYFTDARPDYLLTEVHRQAAHSIVLEFATGVREGKRLIPQRYGSNSIYLPVSSKQAMRFGQVITGTNRERWRRIHKLRTLHGLDGDLPVPGDRVICLKNNRDLDIFNGQMFSVVGSEPHGRDGIWLTVEGEDGAVLEIPAWRDGFRGMDQEKAFEAVAHRRRERAFMTYGWAITCHKSQGSQWGSVLIVDESRWFGKDRVKWLYTAITRAEFRIAVITPNGQ